MPTPMPVLAEFAVELAGGLAAPLLLLSWRVVPPAFFRTHGQVILGLFVLAALALAPASPDRVALGVAVAGAVLAYLATVAWGLGLPRLAVPLTALIVAAAAALLVDASRGAPGPLMALGAAGRLAAGGLIGATVTAMLLGHHYLTAPAMTIDPLRRLVLAIGGTLAVRALLAAVGLWAWAGGHLPATLSGEVAPLFLAVRWGLGLVAPAVATVMTWQTVAIRSTQSATGILYIAVILTLFGELTALTLAHQAGVVF